MRPIPRSFPADCDRPMPLRLFAAWLVQTVGASAAPVSASWWRHPLLEQLLWAFSHRDGRGGRPSPCGFSPGVEALIWPYRPRGNHPGRGDRPGGGAGDHPHGAGRMGRGRVRLPGVGRVAVHPDAGLVRLGGHPRLAGRVGRDPVAHPVAVLPGAVRSPGRSSSGRRGSVPGPLTGPTPGRDRPRRCTRMGCGQTGWPAG